MLLTLSSDWLNRTEIMMDLEDQIWTPDVTIYNRDFVKRREVLDKIGAMFVRKQSLYDRGVEIYFHTQFSTVVICERGMFNYYPWFSRICVFR